MARERPDWEWYQRSSELVAAGDVDAAERVVTEAFEAGHLWRVSLLTAPTLERLHGRPEFERIAAEARRRAEEKHLRPLVLIANPPRRGRGMAPLLLVLHGATGNAAIELERWRPATELGFVVAAGQSSQPATEDGYCWDPPRERVWQDLRAISAGLPPHARVVLAGFSQGAWVALNAALRADLFPAGGVIMVGPFAGSPDNLEPAARRLRIAIIAGAEDTYLDGLEALVRTLRERGHHVSFEVIAGLGHAYPPDFPVRLRQAMTTTSSSSSSQ